MKEKELIIKNDPLASLYQLDEDQSTPNVEISILTNVLDDVEIIGIFGDTLKDILITDEVTGIRILNQLELVIQSIKKEYTERAKKEWRYRFTSILDLLY